MFRKWDREKDYKTVKKWWADHDFTPVQKDLLPDTCYVADECAFACLYVEKDNRAAFMDWIVTDSSLPSMKRAKALKVLIERITELANDSGIKFIVTLTNNVGINKLLRKCEFIETDKNLTGMVYVTK